MSFAEPACLAHQFGESAPPWLASRFAHLCDECATLASKEILEDFGILEAALAMQARKTLSDRWKLLHKAPIKDVAAFRKERADLAARMAEADATLDAAARGLSHAFNEQKPKVSGDVLYALDPPLGRGAAPPRWVLGHSILFMKVEAGETGPGRAPEELGLGVLLPASPWPGRFFMIQDVPDPDHPGRFRGGYVEVTAWVRIELPVKKDRVPEGSGPVML